MQGRAGLLLIACLLIGCLLALPMPALAADATPAPTPAQIAEEIILLPYPDRIDALKAPVVVQLRYGPTKPRRFVTDLIWGPEKAPNLYRLHAEGTVEIAPDKKGPVVTMRRGTTAFTFGPKTIERADKGEIIAQITPEGRFRQIELRLKGLDSMAHRLQFDQLGSALIDTGRVPPFHRLQSRAGPDDTGGKTQLAREKEARIDVLEAIQPMLGLVLDMESGVLHTGSRLTVLRRDLGDLFRDAGPIPLRLEGSVIGLANIDNRRFLTLKLDRAEMTPPMKANVDGYALIDIETALPETVVATIELVVVHDTTTSVFRFVERRALIPEQLPQ